MRAAKTFAGLLCCFLCIWISEIPGSSQTQTNTSTPFYVGLRRSSYGLRKQNADDGWWGVRAKRFAEQFSGSQPIILQILSNYQDDGTTEIEFPKPANYAGSTTNMSFRRGNKLVHEHALATYDAQGVKAILQFEPGNAGVENCFALAQAAFGKHPCVIGMAIDGEWFRTSESADKEGLPMPDQEAEKWMKCLMGFSTNYVLVLKHFDSKKLPPTYRHPNLWLLTDSQEFTSQAEWMTDMGNWAGTFKGSPLGSQFGYPKDQKWWKKNPQPPTDLGKLLIRELPEFRMLLWVDFTADRVEFGSSKPK
jgi:hypothetical protein